MFTSIALVSQPGAELQAIRDELRNPVRYTVREFLSLDDVNQGLKSYHFNLLLMRVNSFDTPHVTMVQKVRARFPDAGLITVSPEIPPHARYQVRDVFRHRLVLEPMEIKDLTKIIDKLARGEAAAPRQHVRVQRQDDCELLDPESGMRLKARFVDFAQMGARLLVNPQALLKRNCRFQLHYRSTTEPGRIHRIETSVIWAAVNSGMVGTIMHGPQQVVGLRFIAAL